MSEIITRKKARELGLAKYFTGEPCKNNHIAERYVMSGTCSECIKASRVMILAPKGEIMPPQNAQIIISESQSQLVHQRQMALQLKEQELTLEKQKLDDRRQFREAQLALQIQGRKERAERRRVAATIKSKMVDVYVLVSPERYEGTVLMVWAYAAARDSSLKPEDIVVRQLTDGRVLMRCFPEDKAEILRATGAGGIHKSPEQLDWEGRARALAMCGEIDRAAVPAGSLSLKVLKEWQERYGDQEPQEVFGESWLR